jgi:hypothetical protein
LFFFAGHGLNIDGRNYLLPSNFYADYVEDVPGNALGLLTDVVQKLQGAEPALQLIITDSCRTPTPASLSSSATGQSIDGRSGVYEPNKNRLRPPQEEFGKNRAIFIYSALEGGASFGTPAGGGRFTTALTQSIVESLNSVASRQLQTRPTLHDIFERARFEMRVSPGRKWQAPQIDETWGSRFYPFPTEEDYRLEKISVEGLRDVEGGDFRKIRDRRICTMRNFLFEFSEFSYFSQQLIEEIRSRPTTDPPLDCADALALGGGRGGSAALPSRDPTGRWSIPALSSPTAVEPPPARPPAGTPAKGTQVDPSQFQQMSTFTKSVTQAATATRAPLARTPVSFAEDLAGRGRQHEVLQLVQQKPTFGDVRNAIQQLPAPPPSSNLPTGKVSLDRAVVAKEDVFLRAAPGTDAAKLTAVRAGELLEVIGTSPGQTWLQVRHPQIGAGYVSGNLIEAALMKLSKSVSFEPNKTEMSDTGKAELIAAFGLLGGVASVDAVIEYPSGDGPLGFARASLTRSFLEKLGTDERKSEPARLSVAIRADRGVESVVQRNTIRVTVLGLPLDQTTRAALARAGATGSSILLDVVKEPSHDSSQPDAKIDLRYCNAAGSCTPVTRETNELKSSVEKALKDVEFKIKDEIPVQIKELRPIIQF